MKWTLFLIASTLILGNNACVQAQTDPFVRDSRQLAAEIGKGNIATVKILLDRGYIDPDMDRSDPRTTNRTWIEWTLQTRISVEKKKQILDLLLNKGADINKGFGQTTPQNVMYPLFLLTRRSGGPEFLDLLNFLLDKGANPNLGTDKITVPILYLLPKSTEALLDPAGSKFLITVYKTMVKHGAPSNPSRFPESVLRVLVWQARRAAISSPDANKNAFRAFMDVIAAVLVATPKASLASDINRLDACQKNLISYTYGISTLGSNGSATHVDAEHSANPALSTAEISELRKTLLAVGGADKGASPGDECSAMILPLANDYIRTTAYNP